MAWAAVAIALFFAFLGVRQWRDARVARALIAQVEAARDSADRRADSARRVLDAADSAAHARLKQLALDRADALKEAARARSTSYELRARLAEMVPDSAAPVLDSLNVAHGNEVAGLQEVIAHQEQEIAVLRGQLVTRDSLIARLSEQVTATERVAELWKQQANAPKGIRLGTTEVAVAGTLIAAVLVLK